MKSRVKRHTVVQPQDQSYRLIPLTKNQNSIIDTEDFKCISQWNWQAMWNERSKTFYARRSIKGKKEIWMHRFILNCASSEQTDHANGNGLDNRRENLRKCTNQQNQRNRMVQCNNSLGFKGVCRTVTKNNRYRAYIYCNKKQYSLGSFATPEEAAHAYNRAAKELHGEFVRLNPQ